MGDNPYSPPKTQQAPQSARQAQPAFKVPLSARVGQVYLAFLFAVFVALIGSLLTVEGGDGELFWLGLFVYSALCTVDVIGIVALRARHSWSWVVAICILWFYGSVALYNELEQEATPPDQVEHETLDTGPGRNPAARVGSLMFLAVACGLPLYLTLVPGVRRRFRERAVFYASQEHGPSAR